MTASVSPLAPKVLEDPQPVAGVRLAVAEAGIKYAGRTDLMVSVFDEGTAVAGVFTKSKCPSAPVDWCRKVLGNGKARVLVVNSGNANAFTGMKGIETVEATAKAAAKAAGCSTDEVFLASTGVIGEPLPPEKFARVLDDVVAGAGKARPLDVARAIMTTDTYPKVVSRTVRMGDGEVTITGVAKGAGMIAPDMATMLSFIYTDAPVSAGALQDILSRCVKSSFNAITVDSDTSTSDTVLAFATGAAKADGVPQVDTASDRRLAAFKRAFADIMVELAQQVVRDGEGARKFIQIDVTGASSAKSAKTIALSIANSPLVKTAVAGEDANWGRVVMAVGKAGEPADRDKLAIRFGDILVAENGERVPGYSEEDTSGYMKGETIEIGVDLGLGTGKARVWTCDLTKEYVAINGDYRS
ncbi:bifunctional glutamate N-acetyltransferase/amino-acid acetyltransferase ArgJ [Tepidamorphus sp. 3E244]|uniref:bifunctional glutamate N-acetyltransferase/amino-acid acetyltransferase ArgJ n=1 Tax=Tepidamorphus sp. 3E244 TaxID=3385498 RepID=UPI0038FCFE28